MLKDDQFINKNIRSNTDELIIGNIKCWVLVGLENNQFERLPWPDHFTNVDGVVFLVDAMDQRQLPEAKKVLDSLLASDELANVPFLVLGNKIDMPQAASEDELRYAFGMMDTYGKETKLDKESDFRPIELYMCSVVRRMGYADGFKWLVQFLS